MSLRRLVQGSILHAVSELYSWLAYQEIPLEVGRRIIINKRPLVSVVQRQEDSISCMAESTVNRLLTIRRFQHHAMSLEDAG